MALLHVVCECRQDVVDLLLDLGTGSELERGIAFKAAEAQGLGSMADPLKPRGTKYGGEELCGW
ncbi:hypothetical protein PG994_015099 [Apiospora phragmitis]|uniref:Uncharacterized protein n=1 Tax=Apiospora phragmitis TaxID=2905665 RepID=A0ABR1SVU0_9PEZI